MLMKYAINSIAPSAVRALYNRRKVPLLHTCLSGGQSLQALIMIGLAGVTSKLGYHLECLDHSVTEVPYCRCVK